MSFSVILSVGSPVWNFIVDRQEGQLRIVCAWFSIIFLDYDFDKLLGEASREET